MYPSGLTSDGETLDLGRQADQARQLLPNTPTTMTHAIEGVQLSENERHEREAG